MSETFDAVIVGGGIVGCACAYYLSQELERVAVIDRGPIGGGVTAAPMGHIAVMDDSEAQFSLCRYSQELWNGLFPMMPPECEVDRCGATWVAADAEEMEHVRQKEAYYRSRGVKAEALDEVGLAQAEPALRKGLAGGLHVPGDSVVFPMTASKWLLESAKRVRSFLGKSVVDLDCRKAKLEDGTEFEGGVVINAAGDRAHELTANLPIELRKGHLVITDRYPGVVRSQLIELGYLKSAHTQNAESVAFNVQPRATGQLLVGSSRQFVGREPNIDRRVLAKMVSRALEFMPCLRGYSAIRTWTGFRPATASHLPIIGHWPLELGLYVAVGHEGLGVTTSVGTGKILADLITGRTPAIDATPFSAPESGHA